MVGWAIISDTKEKYRTINRRGRQKRFKIFQLVAYRIIPADNAPSDCVEKTIKSFKPCALNLSSILYYITNKLLPVTNKKFHPIPKRINPII